MQAETGKAAEERALTRALARGDRSAAEGLVELTYRRIYGALLRLAGGDAELAADLTQETYRKAWAALDGFDGRARFSTWLYRIAYTTFLNHVRKPRRLLPLESEDGEPPRQIEDPSPGAQELLARSGEAAALRRAVLGLPDDLRFTVTARYWQGLPVKEIARGEGITTVAVRKRLKRAFRVLALALEEEA